MSGPTPYAGDGKELFTEERPAVVILGDLLDYIQEMRKLYDDTQELYQVLQDNVSFIGSGSPKGVYPTLSALQTAKPTGDNFIYVVTENGNWYYWNGSSWSSGGVYQASQLSNNSVSPIKTTFFEAGKNLLDYNSSVLGFYVNQTTGAFEANANQRRSDYISVTENQTFNVSYRNKNTGANTANNISLRYAFYNANNGFITGGLFSGATPVFTSPANAKKLVISWLSTNDTLNNMQLEKGSTITDYELYQLKIPETFLNVSSLIKELNTLKKTSQKSSNLIFDYSFMNSIPTNLTNNGGFTASNGLNSPIAVGYDKQIYFNKEVCLDKEKIYTDLKLTSINTIVGVGFRSAIAGLLCEVNFETNKLIIRNVWSDPTSLTPPSVFLEKTISFNPILNRNYLITVFKDTRKNVIFSIQDSLTLEKTTLNCLMENTTSPSNAWGGACLTAIKGSFTVNRFTFTNDQPSNPKIAIYGDSFIEGTTLSPNIQNRYAELLKNALNDNVLIGGKGGDTTMGLINKTDVYSMFKPKYTMLSVGLNDTVFSAYQERITTLINWCIENNSIPVLTTITRIISPDNLAFMRQVNDFVRNSGYHYIDFAKVLSLNYDGETQNTSLFLSDGIHPNVSGHQKMFEKIKVDLPQLFDEF